jgi:hypothetical protein
MCFYAVHAPFTTNPDATGNYSSAVSANHGKFATMIEGMDIAVGEIRRKLIDLGVAEDTLIVFVGDNGSDSPATTVDGLPSGTFNDWPMRGKKGSKWEGGTRVPFIATWASPNPANTFQQAVPIPADSIETDIVTTWDLDGDGVADTAEDPNLNGLVDPGEIDPDSDNTDGDPTPDGVEIELGTDPLDPLSFFYLHGDPQPGSILQLTWPSQPANRFEVRFSLNLLDWSTVLESDLPADAGNTTSYTPPSPASPQGFYRVGLK